MGSSGVGNTTLKPTPASPAVTTSEWVTGETIVLLIRLGGQQYALPADAVRRIVPMAAPTPLQGAPHGVAGLLALGRELLPIVDPRPFLSLYPVEPHPEQHLIVIDADTNFLLWVDRAESVEVVPASAITTVDSTDLLAPRLARLHDEHIPILAPTMLDPGPILRRGR